MAGSSNGKAAAAEGSHEQPAAAWDSHQADKIHAFVWRCSAERLEILGAARSNEVQAEAARAASSSRELLETARSSQGQQAAARDSQQQQGAARSRQ